MPNNIENCITPRVACLLMAVFIMTYRAVSIVSVVLYANWSDTSTADDAIQRLAWHGMNLLQGFSLFLAALMEHVCMMFCVTYVEFLQLVAYNMHQVWLFTDQEPSSSKMILFAIEFGLNVVVFPLLYRYYHQLKTRQKLLIAERRRARQVTRRSTTGDLA